MMVRCQPLYATVISLALLSACVEQTPGTQISIELVGATEAEFTVESGESVDLEQAWVTVGGLELVACTSLSSSVAKWFRALWPVGTAHAHIGDSPTRIGAPLVFDLLDKNTPIDFGTLSPPTGDYCSLDVWVIPADEDSRALPEDARMETRTFLLTGTWKSPGTSESRDLRILGADSAIVNIGFDTPMTLDATTPQASITLGFALPTWFEQISLETTSGVEQSRGVMENIPSSFELSVNLPEN